MYSYSRISQHFMDLKVHHRFHKSPPLVLIPRQTNPVIPPHPPFRRSILILFIHPHSGRSSGHILYGFPTNNLQELLFPIRATNPANLNLFDLTILIMFDEDYSVWISSICSSLLPPVISSSVQTFSSCSLPRRPHSPSPAILETKYRTHTEP